MPRSRLTRRNAHTGLIDSDFAGGFGGEVAVGLERLLGAAVALLDGGDDCQRLHRLGCVGICLDKFAAHTQCVGIATAFGGFLHTLKLERHKFRTIHFGRIGHSGQERGVTGDVAAVGIDMLEVLGCGAGFVGGGIFRDYILVCGDCAVGLTGIQLGDGQQQRTLTPLCGGGEALGQLCVSLDGRRIVRKFGVAFAGFEQRRGDECGVGEALHHLRQPGDFGGVVALQTLHNGLLEHRVVGRRGVLGDGLLIVRGGSGKVGTIVEAVAQTVERVGFQCGDICGGRRGERLQVTAEIVGGAREIFQGELCVGHIVEGQCVVLILRGGLAQERGVLLFGALVIGFLVERLAEPECSGLSGLAGEAAQAAGLGERLYGIVGVA